MFPEQEACEFLWIPSKRLRRINEKNQFIERIVGLSIKTNKRTKEFIPYVLFEALKVRDLRLEPVPHYNSFNNKTDSELVYPIIHSFP